MNVAFFIHRKFLHLLFHSVEDATRKQSKLTVCYCDYQTHYAGAGTSDLYFIYYDS